jgi:hypothetical protein
MAVFILVVILSRIFGHVANMDGEGVFAPGLDQYIGICFVMIGYLLGNFGFIQLRLEKIWENKKALDFKLAVTQIKNHTLEEMLEEKSALMRTLSLSAKANSMGTMLGAIAHRGPEDEQYHAEPGVVLGARRLAIVDLAGGRQPIGNEDGTESGHMIVQYTAAAIVNDIASRAMPASVYSIPTSANAEDHVSMGANEARHVLAMAQDLVRQGRLEDADLRLCDLTVVWDEGQGQVILVRDDARLREASVRWAEWDALWDEASYAEAPAPRAALAA